MDNSVEPQDRIRKNSNNYNQNSSTANNSSSNNNIRPSVSDYRTAAQGSSIGGAHVFNYGSSSSLGKRNGQGGGNFNDSLDTTTPTDREGLRRDSSDGAEFSQNFGRESLVDNLLLSFDRLGQDLRLDSGVNQFFQGTHDHDIEADYEDEEDETELMYNDAEEEGPSRYTTRVYSPTPTGRKRSSSSGGTPSYTTAYNDIRSARGFGSIDYGRRDDFRPYLDAEKRGQGSPSESRRGTVTDRVNDFAMDVYDDAAPTPTVSSRSRMRTPPSHTVLSGANSSRVERRRSTKSVKSVRRMRDDLMDDPLALPPLPMYDISVSPLPPTAPLNKATTRPGFFRRVFGGSGTKAPTASSIQNSTISISANNNSSTHVDVIPVVSTPINRSTVVSPETAPRPPISNPVTPAVAKKSSGFFRRRKKSVSDFDANPMPRIPHHVQQPSETEADTTSPVTSLRTVMNPYLNSTLPPIDANLATPSDQHSRIASRSNSTRGDIPYDTSKYNAVASSPSSRQPDNLSKRPTIRTVASADLQKSKMYTNERASISLEHMSLTNDGKGKDLSGRAGRLQNQHDNFPEF